jgi:tetratricopeptide (TPR) repeat protein
MRKRNLLFACLVLLFVALNISAVLAEQSPSEQLNQLIADLQKNPDDFALREKIIKLSAGMSPAPQVPKEARKPFLKAAVFQKEAKSPSDYELAIKAYDEALAIAPWWPDAYFNLSLAQEGARKYDEAIRSVKYYLMSQPADASKAEDRITVLEAKKELGAKQSAEEAQVKTKAADLAKKERWIGHWVGVRDGYWVDITIKMTESGDLKLVDNPVRPHSEFRIDDGKVSITWPGKTTETYRGKLSEDGRSIEGTAHWYDNMERPYQWKDTLIRIEKQ